MAKKKTPAAPESSSSANFPHPGAVLRRLAADHEYRAGHFRSNSWSAGYRLTAADVLSRAAEPRPATPAPADLARTLARAF